MHYAQPELGVRLPFSEIPTEVLNDETYLFHLSLKDQIPYKSELPYIV